MSDSGDEEAKNKALREKMDAYGWDSENAVQVEKCRELQARVDQDQITVKEMNDQMNALGREQVWKEMARNPESALKKQQELEQKQAQGKKIEGLEHEDTDGHKR